MSIRAGANEFIDDYAKTTQATREAVAEGLLAEGLLAGADTHTNGGLISPVGANGSGCLSLSMAAFGRSPSRGRPARSDASHVV